MTDVQSLEAGPELDRMVAEEIGDTKQHAWVSVGSGITDSAEYCARCGDTLFGDWVKDDPCYKSECIPPFSTDWGFAMLASTMAGIWLCVPGHSDDEATPCLSWDTDAKKWVVAWRKWRLGIGGDYLAVSETIASASGGPLAICRAILAMKQRM